MQNCSHALSIIADHLKLKAAQFDQNRQFLVAIEDRAFCLTDMDDGELEVSFRLPELDGGDAALWRAMLQANEQLTDGGRLALDAAVSLASYGERWRVTDMDAAEIETEFSRVTAAAREWVGERVRAVKMRADAIREMERAARTSPESTTPSSSQDSGRDGDVTSGGETHPVIWP